MSDPMDWLPCTTEVCVGCPDCGFTFAADHTDAPDWTTWSCPACALAAAEARIKAASERAAYLADGDWQETDEGPRDIALDVLAALTGDT